MAKKLDIILKSYRAFLFRVVLSRLEENTHNLSILNNHTEESDLYEYIFDQEKNIRAIIPKGADHQFIEILNHLLEYYEYRQEYEKCKKIFDMIREWDKY